MKPVLVVVCWLVSCSLEHSSVCSFVRWTIFSVYLFACGSAGTFVRVLFVRLSVFCLFVCPIIHLFICTGFFSFLPLIIYLVVRVFVYPCLVCSFVCALFVRLSVICLFVCLCFVCSFVCALFVRLSVFCLFVCPIFHLFSC